MLPPGNLTAMEEENKTKDEQMKQLGLGFHLTTKYSKKHIQETISNRRISVRHLKANAPVKKVMCAKPVK